MTKEKLIQKLIEATVQYLISYINYEEYYVKAEDPSDYAVTLSFNEYQKSSSKLDTYWDSYITVYGSISNKDKIDINNQAFYRVKESLKKKKKGNLWDKYEERILLKRHFRGN